MMFDDSNEWLVDSEMGANMSIVKDDLVFSDQNLTWGDVTRAAIVGETRISTRGKTKDKHKSIKSCVYVNEF